MESPNLPVLKYYLLPFFLLCFLPFTCIANAQGIPASPENLSLTASPSNPSPGDQVTITAVSYTIDINGATVIWSVNGKQVQKGLGQTTLTLPAPALGKASAVSVAAIASSGQTVTGAITITSGSVDMIIEPSGYVPPFFMGKNPVVYQNAVKIVAIPHLANPSGIEYAPSSLVYTWKQNDGTVLQDQSGYGKQSVTIPGALVPRAYTLTVDVGTKDGSVSTEGNVFVQPQAPSLSFYVNDPLYGPLFNTVVGNSVHLGSQNEISVLAVPYGFDKPQAGVGNVSFNWLINNNPDSALDSSDSIVLRAPDGQSGSSNIELDLNNPVDLLQQTSGVFSAVFNSGGSGRSAASSSPVVF